MPNKNNSQTTDQSTATDKPARHNARDNKTRFNVRIPTQLFEKLKAESTRTGRGMTDIVIEQLWYRYPQN